MRDFDFLIIATLMTYVFQPVPLAQAQFRSDCREFDRAEKFPTQPLAKEVSDVLKKCPEPDCFSDLTDQDKKIIAKIDKEIKTLRSSDLKKIAQIQSKYESQLSVAAKIAIIAESFKRDMESFASTLKNDPELSNAYLVFDQEIKHLSSKDSDTQNLDKAIQRFKNSISKSSLTKDSKKHALKNILLKNLYKTAQVGYRAAAKHAETTAHEYALATLGAEVTLSGSLIVFAAMTAGLGSPAAAAALAATGSTAAGWLTGIAVSSVSAAAAGAGFLDAIEVSKQVGHAAFATPPDSNFFCTLAHDVYERESVFVQQGLFGAALCGAAGAGLGALASIPAAAAAFGTVSTIGMTAFYAVGTFPEWVETVQIFNAAHEAERKGDSAKAKELLLKTKDQLTKAQAKLAKEEAEANKSKAQALELKAKRRAVDSVADTISMLLTAAGSKPVSVVMAGIKGPKQSFSQLLHTAWMQINGFMTGAARTKLEPGTYAISHKSHDGAPQLVVQEVTAVRSAKEAPLFLDQTAKELNKAPESGRWIIQMLDGSTITVPFKNTKASMDALLKHSLDKAAIKDITRIYYVEKPNGKFFFNRQEVETLNKNAYTIWERLNPSRRSPIPMSIIRLQRPVKNQQLYIQYSTTEESIAMARPKEEFLPPQK
jgi:ribosomal protein S21